MNAVNIKSIRKLSNMYKTKFSEIIFEHLGDGLINLLDNGQDIDQFLVLYRNMLASGGKIIYESYRGAVIQTWDDSEEVHDVGLDDQIKKTFSAINTKFYNGTININNLEDKMTLIKAFYTMILIKNGFTRVVVNIKKDPIYRKYNPSKVPYYYLEIKCNLQI